MKTQQEGSSGFLSTKSSRVRWVAIAAAIVVLAVVIVNLVQSGDSTLNGGPIKAEWVEPHVAGDVVSMSLAEVEQSGNVHFKVETEERDMHFMAYVLNGQIHVRASVCPPCWGIAYSLDRDILVCDMCATTFSARTGDGIRGPCVNYPKAAVAYETVDDSIVMSKTDLSLAYENTLEPGWP